MAEEDEDVLLRGDEDVLLRGDYRMELQDVLEAIAQRAMEVRGAPAAPAAEGGLRMHPHGPHGAPVVMFRNRMLDDEGRPLAMAHGAWDEAQAGDGDVPMDEELMQRLNEFRLLVQQNEDAADRHAGLEDGIAGGRRLYRGAGDQGAGSREQAVESFTDDENAEEAADTTAEQLKQGKDIQGIPWERLQFERESYRKMRLRSFRNYTNILPDDAAEYREEIQATARPQAPSKTGCFYDFVSNTRTVQSTIVHFQLRNLVWSTSRNDVFVVHDNSVVHWNPATRQLTPVLDLTGGQAARRMPGVGAVQVSTMCVKDGLLAVGGFNGELVVLRLEDTSTAFSARITRNDNGITNGIDICHVRGAGPCVLAANNDCTLRLYSADTFQLATQVSFPWAVNYSVVDPGGRLAAVVGDNEVAYLTDLASGSGRTVAQLQAHRDYAFGVTWHPDGMMLATGNQDTTAAVWDLRKLSAPVARLVGHMGAIRSLRFSPDGRYLAMAEPADFVHIYDVQAGFSQVQEIDLFGEISGISFSPHADAFFVGVADLTYSSLLEFDRHHHSSSSSSPEGKAAGNVYD